MSSYEIVFLVEKPEEAQAVKELIIAVSGKITKEESWGKKQLAYPIRTLRSAEYYCWQFDLDPTKMNELKKKMSYHEKLLRSVIFKAELPKVLPVTHSKKTA